MLQQLKQYSLELFELFSKTANMTDQRYVDAYYNQLADYENYVSKVDNKINNFIISKINHHLLNSSIQLEKFGFFISASANYIFGKQAMYNRIAGAQFVKYNVLRTSAFVGYEFKDLILANDSLNLYINSYYNSKEFIDKDSEYIFGMGIRYEL